MLFKNEGKVKRFQRNKAEIVYGQHTCTTRNVEGRAANSSQVEKRVSKVGNIRQFFYVFLFLPNIVGFKAKMNSNALSGFNITHVEVINGKTDTKTRGRK